ncbi:MAG: acetyl-CoA carboxylase subunit beta [Verrucomicrobia bacterium 61-8]|nr:acetyl-CoA carboxylase carboxyltransferase subunit beta [Verrucomicrobiota bacterium]OJV12289.1 MAG: acetyl-CoA carboxylase subunit beta [Verrucomicrobia bacterium 61-8]
MPIFRKPFLKNIVSKTREMPEGLWTKCPSCAEVIHNLALEENLRICPKCEHHFSMGSKERIASLIDEGTFEETDANMTSVDTLEFKGVATYTNRLKSYQEKTGLTDAVVTGTGKIDGRLVGIAVMDFSFLAATMGSVVGEKITRIIELSTKKKMGVVIVCASGGARMYEGMLSLMQMAKTSGALARHSEARLPYLTVLTNPTTAGVMASYASLGDVLIAEPKSMIGFAGPRVIKETTHQDLPPGFQTAEFLEKHGLIDIVVSRTKLRGVIRQLLDYLAPASK